MKKNIYLSFLMVLPSIASDKEKIDIHEMKYRGDIEKIDEGARKKGLFSPVRYGDSSLRHKLEVEKYRHELNKALVDYALGRVGGLIKLAKRR